MRRRNLYPIPQGEKAGRWFRADDASCMGGDVAYPLTWPKPTWVERHSITIPYALPFLFSWKEKMTSSERHEARYRRRRARREAKRAGDVRLYTDWESILGFDALFDAYSKCAKGTRWKASVQTFGGNLAINVRRIANELENGTWKSKGFHTFDIIERGKHRRIQSVHISERCVQRALCDNCLTPLLTQHMIYDNGATLKGKGTDFALDRFEGHLRRHYRKYGTDGWIYQFDFKSYFSNIDNLTLLERIEPIIQDPGMMQVISQLVLAFGERGLGLGSQVSQILAVYYPSPVDHLVKDKLGVEGYGRYNDDGYIICHDRDKLVEIVKAFTEACASLGILLNEKKCRIQRITRPIRFLKVRFQLTETGMVVRRLSRQTARRERRRLKAFGHIMTQEEILLSFHSWMLQQTRGRSYFMRLDMARYYRKLYGKASYVPPKRKTRTQKVAWHIAMKARRDYGGRMHENKERAGKKAPVLC